MSFFNFQQIKFKSMIATYDRGLIILRGIPAAGKTTCAHALVQEREREGIPAMRIGRDDVRNLLCLADQPRRKCIGTRQQENMVTSIESTMIRAAFESGIQWVIEDSTNLHSESIRRLEDLARECGVNPFVWLLNVDVETAIARDARREDSCGEDVIRRMASRMGTV